MNNLDYLYENLPARFRRDDKDLFLKRFLQFFGETLDNYDTAFDEFFQQINPATARIDFVEFWLKELFDWNWFPYWFTHSDKRRLYGNMARHLARRGTATGIVEWLADFWISAAVHKSPVFYGEFCYGEDAYFVNEPLTLIVQIGRISPPDYQAEMCAVGDCFYGESFYATAPPLLQISELEKLLQWAQPNAQEIIVSYGSLPEPKDELFWEVLEW